jgi:bifunctional UDP-N-acetylglucosamine pyrophosphorylase/glucosamine-1-phosphate N-acetyltransferase
LSARTTLQAAQRGSGDAVRAGLPAIGEGVETVLVVNGDMPLIEPSLFRQVLAARDAHTALALVTARMPLTSRFGRVIRGGETVRKIVEARDCTPDELAIDEMNAGVYAYDPAALRGAIDELRADNAQGELYLTDTIALLVARGARVVAVPCDDPQTVLGVNDRVELAAARAILNQRLCERHMLAGVTIVDPAVTYLEPELTIDADVVIYPNTTLGGTTTIAGGARIGPNSRIFGSTIGEGTRITDSIVLNCTIGAHVSIGPFAHLRDGAILEPDVHVGNFVEVKKSKLERGVKSAHLTYLGDATIGENTNVGAGTITCNYDGVRKNQTKIGRNVFIGSNSALVAPIEIGDGAVTGAGAVVIHDVAAEDRVVGNPARSIGKVPKKQAKPSG